MAHDHIIKEFDDELMRLQLNVSEMGNDCLAMIKNAARALAENDKELATHVITSDKKVNLTNHKIILQAQNLIALRSPMANDLRLILTALQVATNLERIGDLSKNIAKIVARNDLVIERTFLDAVDQLAQKVSKNVSDVLIAFGALDEREARRSYLNDQNIDSDYKALFSDLMKAVNDHHKNSESLLLLLFTIRHLERIGDHAKNIAEQTHYAATGLLDQFDMLDDDTNANSTKKDK